MRKRLPYLRIAFSALCIVASLVLVVLWVRSNEWRDEVRIVFGGDYRIIFESLYDRVRLVASKQQMRWPVGPGGVRSESTRQVLPQSLYIEKRGASQSYYYGRFGLAHLSGQYMAVGMPHWAAAVLCLVIGSAPWVRWVPSRYSPRAMLIATTIIDIVLGLLAYANNRLKLGLL